MKKQIRHEYPFNVHFDTLKASDNLRKIIEDYIDLHPGYPKFEDYEVSFGVEYDYGGGSSLEIKVTGIRMETDEEYENRRKKEADDKRKRSAAAKKAAKTKAEAAEKREKTLYENLKKKYG